MLSRGSDGSVTMSNQIQFWKTAQIHFFKNKRGEKSTFVNLSITTINLENTMKKKKLIWMNFALSIVKWNMNYY